MLFTTISGSFGYLSPMIDQGLNGDHFPATMVEPRRTRIVCGLVLAALAVCVGAANAQTFSSPVSYALGDNPNWGVAGNFNGDTKPDLAIANVLQKNVSILLNNGDGTFSAAVNYLVDFNPEALATADFNGDGKLDLAVGNFFGGPTSSGNISILLGNGNGTFQSAVNYDAGTPYNLAVADLNGDGKLDLVAASWSTNKATVLLGNGNGTFQSAVTYSTGTEPRGVAIADFNGDTKPDLAVTNTGSGNTSILLGNGNGTFQTATNHVTGSGPIGVIATDLDGDTKQDLIIAAVGSNAVLVLLGNGNGTFLAPVPYVVGDGPQRLVFDDFNGDAKGDVIVVNSNTFSYSTLRGNANGTFLAAVTMPARPNSLTPISADFDKDGKPDLAIVNNGFDLVDIRLNSPSVRGTNISATATVPATVLVATFVDYDNSKTAGSFTASINWGDATAPSMGTVVASVTAGFNVTGTHTYASPGNYNVVVQIADDSGNLASATSTAVVKAPTSITLSTSVTPSDFGQSVTFTATVTSGTGTPSGTVQFKDNGNNLGTAAALNGSGIATLTTSAVTVGTHIITAQYSGAATFEASSGTLSGGQVVRPLPTLSINDVSITEGDSGTSSLMFTVTLSAASNLTVTVNFATADFTATAGVDYQAATGGLIFNPGQTTKTVSVTVTGDALNEEDESFFLNISNPVNAATSDAQGTGTIVNDDAPVLLIDDTTGRALALDSVILTRDPFSLLNPNNLNNIDQRTRLSLLVWRLGLLPNDTVANLTVSAADSMGRIYPLVVEYEHALATLNGVTQIIVRMPDNVIGAPRDLSVKVQLRGPASNSAIIKIAAP